MKTEAELRAAAERAITGQYSMRVRADGLPQKDRYMLAEAWLAANPVDGEEPADILWLRSIGFRESKLDASEMVFDIDDTHSASIYCDGSASVTHYIDDDQAECPLAEVYETRGAVRRLCAALGIQLREPNQ